MSASLTKFSVLCPLFSDGTSQQNAWNTFLSNMRTLTSYVLTNISLTDTNNNQSSYNQVDGYLTSGQTSTALGYLNLLNSSLGFNVQCYVNGVTSQP